MDTPSSVTPPPGHRSNSSARWASFVAYVVWSDVGSTVRYSTPMVTLPAGTRRVCSSTGGCGGIVYTFPITGPISRPVTGPVTGPSQDEASVDRQRDPRDER